MDLTDIHLQDDCYDLSSIALKDGSGRVGSGRVGSGRVGSGESRFSLVQATIEVYTTYAIMAQSLRVGVISILCLQEKL